VSQANPTDSTSYSYARKLAYLIAAASGVLQITGGAAIYDFASGIVITTSIVSSTTLRVAVDATGINGSWTGASVVFGVYCDLQLQIFPT
jgi:hypothetical protein